MLSSRKGFGAFLVNLSAIIIASLLFAASFPNLLVKNGIPFLAWFAYVPIFWLISRVRLRTSFFWGALYGYIAYSLFNYWLSVFHPLAGLIVNFIYLCYFAVLFPVLKLSGILFPKRGYIVQWVIWIAYEYLRTQGFLGYSYGITGYSQWTQIPIIQIASIFGVWGVSALVVFPSVFLGASFKDWLNTGSFGECLASVRGFFRREWLSAGVWALCFVAALVYGFVSPQDYSDAPKARIALIQHNTDPWRGDMVDYRNNYRILKRLSEEALAVEPKPDLVVWSETAFVPRIYWHIHYRGDEESYQLVRELLDFLDKQDVPFIIGNDDGRREVNEEGVYDRVDYNAVMLFQRSEMVQLYRKLHLVPFTEHFPYRKQLPMIYEALVNADTHFWKTGNEATVFEAAISSRPETPLKFSTPICFEDTFGYLSRNFVRSGAELIVNLSNDAWSRSLPAQNQHLSMAVFRAVENRRSMVRSTASGQTCSIDPNGRVLALAAPFTESQLTVETPIVSGETLYTRYGDIWAQLFLAAALALLLAGAVRFTIIKLFLKKPTGK